MLYAIIARDTTDSAGRRAAARSEHRARLEALLAEGRLVLAGPFPGVDAEEPGAAGFLGSLIVAEFASEDDARRWAESDPFATGGAYASVDVLPFKQVLP